METEAAASGFMPAFISGTGELLLDIHRTPMYSEYIEYLGI